MIVVGCLHINIKMTHLPTKETLWLMVMKSRSVALIFLCVQRLSWSHKEKRLQTLQLLQNRLQNQLAVSELSSPSTLHRECSFKCHSVPLNTVTSTVFLPLPTLICGGQDLCRELFLPGCHQSIVGMSRRRSNLTGRWRAHNRQS